MLGDAPAVAMGNLMVTTSQALSNAAHNATNNQQQSYVTMQASTSQGVATLLSVDTALAGIDTRDIYCSRRVTPGRPTPSPERCGCAGRGHRNTSLPATPGDAEVTDSVTSTDVLDVGQAPSVALAMTFVAMADSIALAMGNAVANQQRGQVIANAALVQVLTLILIKGAAGK